jgi:hypothetical protein
MEAETMGESSRSWEVEVRALLDRQAIWDCLMRYTRGVDRLDQELIRSAFWGDARDSHGQMDGSAEQFIRTWMPTQAVREACQHSVSNHYVELAGDAANAETYFQVAIRNAGSEALELVGGRYLDRYTRRRGEWRIQTRLVVLDWQCLTDATQMDHRLATSHRGSRDRRDPSYERPVRPRTPPPLPPS